MAECLFCKIVNKELPVEVIYEDESVLAFRDISPQAKEHLLFINKSHTKNVNEITEPLTMPGGFMILKINEIALRTTK